MTAALPADLTEKVHRGRGSAPRDRHARSSSSRTGSSRSRPCATERRCCGTARPWAWWMSRPAPRSASSVDAGTGRLMRAAEDAAPSSADALDDAATPDREQSAEACRQRPAGRDAPSRRLVRAAGGRGAGRSSRSRVRARTSCSASSSGARRAGRGQPPGRWPPGPLRTPGRRHPRGHRVRARQPGRGAPDAALRAREHRTALLRPAPGLGPHPRQPGADPGGRRHRPAADRHPGTVRGAHGCPVATSRR